MTLPRIFGAGRRRLFAWLALNGIAQAFAAIAASLLLSEGLANGASVGAMPPLILTGLLAAGVSVVVLRTFERAQAERLGQLYVNACRLRLFKALSDLPLRGGPKVRYGIMMTRMITDLTSLKNWVARGVAKLTVASFSITGAVAALTIISPGLAAVTGVVLTVLLLVGLGAGIVFHMRVRKVRRLRGRLSGNVGELARARGLPRHFGRLAFERKKLRGQGRDLSDALVQRSYAAGLMRALSDAVMPMTIAATALGASFIQDLERLPIATLAVGLFLIGLASGPLRDLMLALEYRSNFSIGRQRIKEAFSEFVKPPEPEACALGVRQGPASLRLDGALIPDIAEPVYAGLAPGDSVLLAGPSGSGKTGLLCAIARLASPDDGSALTGIALDGCNLPTVSAAAWHARIKLISNEFPLLKGSLSRNVRYGNPSLDEAKVHDVLETCGVDIADPAFPAGLHSTLEEGARNLSSGLRSRITLARAIASDPGLLLIDDPNFLVDEECASVLRTIAETGAFSLIVAAPGVCEVLPFDQVWMLDNGHLVTADQSIQSLSIKRTATHTRN